MLHKCHDFKVGDKVRLTRLEMNRIVRSDTKTTGIITACYHYSPLIKVLRDGLISETTFHHCFWEKYGELNEKDTLKILDILRFKKACRKAGRQMRAISKFVL